MACQIEKSAGTTLIRVYLQLLETVVIALLDLLAQK
jgi:hypothetical protein